MVENIFIQLRDFLVAQQVPKIVTSLCLICTESLTVCVLLWLMLLGTEIFGDIKEKYCLKDVVLPAEL
jgi:hypothetical protein